MLILSLKSYEQHLTFCYLTNAASRLHYDSKEADKFIEWVGPNDPQPFQARRTAPPVRTDLHR